MFEEWLLRMVHHWQILGKTRIFQAALPVLVSIDMAHNLFFLASEYRNSQKVWREKEAEERQVSVQKVLNKICVQCATANPQSWPSKVSQALSIAGANYQVKSDESASEIHLNLNLSALDEIFPGCSGMMSLNVENGAFSLDRNSLQSIDEDTEKTSPEKSGSRDQAISEDPQIRVWTNLIPWPFRILVDKAADLKENSWERFCNAMPKKLSDLMKSQEVSMSEDSQQEGIGPNTADSDLSKEIQIQQTGNKMGLSRGSETKLAKSDLGSSPQSRKSNTEFAKTEVESNESQVWRSLSTERDLTHSQNSGKWQLYLQNSESMRDKCEQSMAELREYCRERWPMPVANIQRRSAMRFRLNFIGFSQPIPYEEGCCRDLSLL